jgi:hypothetical protein
MLREPGRKRCAPALITAGSDVSRETSLRGGDLDTRCALLDQRKRVHRATGHVRAQRDLDTRFALLDRRERLQSSGGTARRRDLDTRFALLDQRERLCGDLPSARSRGSSVRAVLYSVGGCRLRLARRDPGPPWARAGDVHVKRRRATARGALDTRFALLDQRERVHGDWPVRTRPDPKTRFALLDQRVLPTTSKRCFT